MEMSRKQSTALISATIGLVAMSAACSPPAPKQESSIVRQIDHILIVSNEAPELFSLLTETFQLPVAWPLSDYGGFACGGVAVGAVNLEIIKETESPARAEKSRWTGFALEPEPLESSLAELDARGIQHGTPAPFRSSQPDGWFKLRWTTVGLPEVSNDKMQVFLCQYEDDLPARRSRLLEQLRSREWGPLSISSIREIVVGAKDWKRMQAHWQKLLEPLQESSPGVWPLAAGPAIRLIEAEYDGICGLVVKVKSLPQARQLLEAQGLLGAEQAATLTVGGSHLRGLNITLVEQALEAP
jgi:hypothetical protein